MTSEYAVARIDELPEGAHIVVEVNGREIGLFNVKGTLYALPNVCVHQSGPLCRGAISGTLEAGTETNWQRRWAHEGEIVVCPWHALEYNITTGQCLAYPNRRLPLYPVVVKDDEVKVVI